MKESKTCVCKTRLPYLVESLANWLDSNSLSKALPMVCVFLSCLFFLCIKKNICVLVLEHDIFIV